MAKLEAAGLLQGLVAIDSVSALPNAPMIDSLDAQLRALGFSTTRHVYRDPQGVEKANLVGRAGPAREGSAGLALVGHTDTVPYDPAWSEALRLTRRDGKLYGRGACDTKGFIACALSAASRIDLGRLREPLFLAFTADEEVGCLGAKVLAERAALRPRHAIVGEPTELRPIRAHKGYCLAEIVVRGVEGHSAYPSRGESAIFGAGEILRGLEALARELALRESPEFDPPHTTLNVGVVAGGKAKNIVPGECRLTLEWRPVPGDRRDEVPERAEELLQELVRARPRLSAELRRLRSDAGANTPREAELVRFLEAESGQTSGSVSFGTEAPELAALGAEPVIFGPGDIKVAHQTGEFVPEGELARCAEILARAIARFC
ncbi:MAG: acetylornithine deacetylase [Deltaproteobacteria bacterium]